MIERKDNNKFSVRANESIFPNITPVRLFLNMVPRSPTNHDATTSDEWMLSWKMKLCVKRLDLSTLENMPRKISSFPVFE